MVISGAFFKSEYDAVNPVYDKRTDDNGYAFSATYSHDLAIIDGSWSWFGNVNYADLNSAVNFHDATALVLTRVWPAPLVKIKSRGKS